MIDYTLQICWLTIIILLGMIFQIKILKEIRNNTKVQSITIERTVNNEAAKFIAEAVQEDKDEIQ